MEQPNIFIYSTNGCKYCEQAKTLLKMKGLEYEEKMVLSTDDRMMLKEQFPNARSFPIVTVDGVHIGGFTQLQDWIKTITDSLR